MLNYITSNLLKNENILYFGHRHWIVLATPVMWFVFGMAFFLMSGFVKILSIFLLLTALATGIRACIDYFMSEIGVTDMRVLIKTGLIARYSLETNLQNIASIQVEQGILGRILNYGTIIVCDTGYLRSPFSYIDNPFEFRRQVLKQIDTRYPTPPKPSQ